MQNEREFRDQIQFKIVVKSKKLEVWKSIDDSIEKSQECRDQIENRQVRQKT
jgi:hypothetical protein